MQNEHPGKSSVSQQVPYSSTGVFGRYSPLRLFSIIIASIFFAELIAMAVVYFMPPLPYQLLSLIDAGIMVILVFPILYALSFRPLLQHIEKLQEVEKSLQLLSNVVQQTADTVVVTNCDGVIEYVNPAFETVTGYSREEALGQTPRLLKSGIHDADFYRNLWDTVLAGQTFYGEITNRRKNGELFHEVKTITPLRDGQGTITHFVATGKDITERKLAEENLRKAHDDLEIRIQERTEELQIANSELEDEINVRRRAEVALQEVNAKLQAQAIELEMQAEELKVQREGLITVNEDLRVSEERLSRAQEMAHLGSWELDLVNNRLTWSDEVYRIFGLRPQEFGATYEAFLDAVHPDDCAMVDAAYSGSIRDGRDTYEIVHRVVRRSSGEIRIVREKCEHIQDEAGQIVRSIGMVHDITEGKKAEEYLQRFQLLSEHSRDIILFMRRDDGGILEANAAAADAYGYSRDELLSLSVQNLRAPNTQNLTVAQMTQADGRGILFETVHQRKDGSCFPVEVSSKGATITGVRTLVSVVRDITERKKAEEALRASEEKFRRAFADAAIAFAMTAPDGRFLDANPAYCALTGCTLEELQESDFQSLIHPDDRAANMELIDKMLAGEIADFVVENRYISKDEKNVWVRKSVSLVHSADGSPQWIIALVEDINERKQAEEALRRAHDRLEIRVRERTEELAAANRELSAEITERKAIESHLRIQTAAMKVAANGILIADRHGNIQWINPALNKITGYEDRELLGQSTRIFNSGKHDADFYRQMWNTVLSGQVWRGETTNRRKDGTLYVEEQTITPVPDGQGQISHFIAIKQDVTERNSIYSQLEDSNRDLRKLTASERQLRFLAEGLVESSVALNMSLELHAVLDRIFEQTRRTIPYLLADVILIQDGVATVVQRWGENLPELGTIPENENLKLEDFPIWEQILETKLAVMIPDTALDHRWNTNFGTAWIRSYLGAPLIYGEQVIGIISLGSDQANAFFQDMVKTLAAFAAPAAVAIQNARLYKDEQENRKIAEILSAASVALSQTLDIEMVMETILDYMQFILPVNVAFVILSEGDERYRVRAIRSEGDDRMQYDELQDQMIDVLNEPVVGPFFTKPESTFVPDSRQIANWSPPFELTSMNCWLGIPLASIGKTLGMVVIANANPHSFTEYQIGLADAVVKQAVVALQNAWLFEQVRSGRERLQQLSRHLVEVQENERKFIARELHDESSQSLTSLKMGLQVIEQKAAGHADVLEQVKHLKHLADETLESLHHLAVNLRPASLDHLGLEDALTGLIESTRQRSGLMTRFKTMGSYQPAALTEEIKASIYRIVQESLTNVVRHAQASYVDVILEWHDDRITIIIEDDGVGLDLQKARETGHLGLVGMQERAEMLGGKFAVDSTPQSGTTLVVEIPYGNSNTL